MTETPDTEPAVDEPLPEQTDNSVKPEDGEQDVDQSPASAYDADGNQISGVSGA